MAIMLETLIVPCASVVPSASLTSVVGASISRCSSIRFSQFRGFEILQNRRGAFVSSTSKLASHGVEESFVKLGKLHLKVLRAILTSQLIILSNGVAGVTDATWKSLVLESDLPVLVEFWAPWCGSCRMMHPLIDKLAKQYAGKLNCYNVNTDESPSIATQYAIRSIPTVIIFKNGEKKDAVVGAVPESTLTTSIEKFL